MRAERGFSLIELILCVALVGILVKVALPKFSVSKHMGVKAAARRIAGDFRFARHLAILNGCPYWVVFDPYLNQYKVYKNTVNAQNQISQTRQLDAAIVLSGDTSFAFQSTGQATTGSSLTVSTGGYTWGITVTAVTGYVHIQNQ